MIHGIVSKYKRTSVTFKATVWYTVCMILQKLAAFLLIPFLTRMLSTNEYGFYTVFLSWLDIIEIFFTLRIYSNGFVAGIVKNSDNQKAYTASIQVLLLVLVGIATAVLIILTPVLSKITNINSSFFRLMPFSFIATSGIGVWSAKQRVNNKYKQMVIVTLLYSVLVPIFTIIAVGLTDSKLSYAINTRIIGQFIIALPFVFLNLVGAKDVKKQYIVEALKYNIPLIPYYLSMILLNNSDRIMIQQLCGQEQAAIYSVAYSLSATIFIFSGALNQSLQPWTFQKIKNKITKKETKIITISVAFIALLALIVLLVAPEVLFLFAPPSYHEAVWTMPPIISSLLVMYIYQQFLNVHFYVGNNNVVFLSSVLAATLNIGLNYMVLPVVGYIGAGYTTLISYFVIGVIYYISMISISKKKSIEYKNLFDIPAIFGIMLIFTVLAVMITALYNLPYVRYGVLSVMIIVAILKRRLLMELARKLLRR